MRHRVPRQDRVLIGVFVLHLVVALAFGSMFLKGLGDQPTQLAVAGDGTAAGGTTGGAGGAGAVATAGQQGAATGTAGGSATAGSGGSGDQTGATAAQTEAASEGQTPSAGTSPAGTAASGGSGGQDGVADGEPIKVGTLVTQTGPINFKASAQATKAYLDMVNEQGGVNGHPIELMLRDDGLDPARGRRAVEEMLNAGVFSFVAFTAPLTEQSLNPTLEKHQIPLVGAFGIGASEYSFMFNGFFESFGWVSARFLAEQGVTNPGLIYISRQDDKADQRIVQSWKQGFESAGVAFDESNAYGVDVTKSSYDDIVTQLRIAGVDGIATSIDGTALIRLQQSLNRANYHPVHAASQLADDPRVLNDPDVGASFEGTFVYSDFHFLGEPAGEMGTYEAEVRKRFGDSAELNWAGKNGWVGAKLFVDALQAAGPNPTRQGLMQALRSMTDHPTGLTVPLTIGSSPTSQIRNNRCIKVGKVVAGKVQPVTEWRCYDGELLG